eukprot:scaffold1356_cov123-Cylindrotheca_fusiformis.AAC.13
MCFPTATSLLTHADLALPSDLVLPSEWDHDTEMLNEEELSASSHEEACKVLEKWQTDQDHDLDIMEVDEQIGSNLLGDELFGAPCMSPTSPLEELHVVSPDHESKSFFAPIGDDFKSKPVLTPSHLDERYKATLLKLKQSMRRSQDTRKALSLKTHKTAKYNRRKSVSGVLLSIEKSSRQVDQYLKVLQRQNPANFLNSSQPKNQDKIRIMFKQSMKLSIKHLWKRRILLAVFDFAIGSLQCNVGSSTSLVGWHVSSHVCEAIHQQLLMLRDKASRLTWWWRCSFLFLPVFFLPIGQEGKAKYSQTMLLSLENAYSIYVISPSPRLLCLENTKTYLRNFSISQTIAGSFNSITRVWARSGPMDSESCHEGIVSIQPW